MSKKNLPLFIIFSAVLVLYFPVLKTYFSQDDFFHFKVSLTDGSLKEFVRLFGFYRFNDRGYAFYRPIFREALYNIFYSFFGLNQYPFRLLQLCIHFINIYLVYAFINKLLGKPRLAFFSAFFFAISAANVGILYYLAGGIQAEGATMFMLAALICFMNKRKLLPLALFVLALMSHEQAVIIPILLAGLIWVKEKKFGNAVASIIRELWPYALVVSFYLYLDFFVIGFSGREIQYQPVFAVGKTLNTLAWYVSWSMGLPEMTVDYVRSGLKLDPRLMRFWGKYFVIIFPAFFVSWTFVFASGLKLLIKARAKLFNKKIIFLALWVPLSLASVMFLPLHKKTYYLSPALPAFWAIVGYLVYAARPRLLPAFILGLLVLNVVSIKLAEKTYWAINRGRLAGVLVRSIKKEYPELPKGAVVYFVDDPDYKIFSEEWGGTSRQAYYALSGSDALQLLYKDPSLRVYYEDVGRPENFYYASLYEIVAKFD